MQIILASAKIMNPDKERYEQGALPPTSEPPFLRAAERFAQEMAGRSVEELQAELKCNRQLAAETKLRYQEFPNPNCRLPAVLAYFGQAYKCLDAASLNADDLLFANRRLWILSFLYGMLRPLNHIHPYRMEGKVMTGVSAGRTMFEYWKPVLTDFLIDNVKADDGILVHLATAEYQQLFDWKRVLSEVCVVQPRFYVQKGDELKNITVYAKSCRGAMTRHIIRNRATLPEQLTDFEYNGFRIVPRSVDETLPKSGPVEWLWTARG